MVGGEDGSFLPAYEVGEVVSCEVGSALRFFELRVGGSTRGQVDVGHAAQRIGDLAPWDEDGFGEELRLARVEFFYGAARGGQLCLDGGERAEWGGLCGERAAHAAAERVFALGAETGDEDPAGGEELIGGVPDE